MPSACSTRYHVLLSERNHISPFPLALHSICQLRFNVSNRAHAFSGFCFIFLESLVPSSPGCEAKGDTVLYWRLKRLKRGYWKGDRAEKTSFNLVRKTDFLPMKGSHVCIGLWDAKGNRQPPENHIWLIITECVGVFDLPRLMVTGTHMWPKKGVCLFIQQRIRTERSGF